MTPTLRTVAFTVLTVLALAGARASSQISVSSSGGPLPQGLADLVGGPQAGTKPMEAGTGLIMGRVVDGAGGGGVPGAIVTLTLAGFTPLRAQADGDGRFAFRALPKGNFSISSTRPGWADGAAGRTRPGGPARGVTLTDDQRVGDIEIPMWRHASISGVVLDENNEPLVGAQVRVLRREFNAGYRRLTLGASDTTDDRGQYRISGLEAGEYLVVVPIIHRPSLDAMMSGLRDGAMAAAGGGGGGGMMVAMRVEATASAAGAPMVISSLDGAVPAAGTTPEGLPLTYQTEYYTGALAAARATPVVVAHGEERSGVDFTMRPVRALSIAGQVTGPEGPVADVQIQLLPADAAEMTTPIETATASSDADGNFRFDMVPAGQYTLRALKRPRVAGNEMMFTQTSGVTTVVRQSIERSAASAPLPNEPTLWAEVPVGVGTQDLAGVGIALRTGLTVSGTVNFIGSATQPTPEQRAAINIMLEPADGRTAGLTGMVRGRVDANGTFTTMGVAAGKYVLRVMGAPPGWSLRDAEHGGRDITSAAVTLDGENATGVVVTFTDRTSEVNGSVRDASGNPDARASVIAFPTDQALWVDTGSQPRRLRQVRAGQDGSYRLQGLPAGDYYVVAIDDASVAQWQDPAYLGQISRSATQVRLLDGDTRTQQLSTVRGER